MDDDDFRSIGVDDVLAGRLSGKPVAEGTEDGAILVYATTGTDWERKSML